MPRPQDNPAWARVFENPRLRRGRNISATQIRVGDTIHYHDHHVKVLVGPYAVKDRFGRELIAYTATVVAGPSGRVGETGEILFGPTGVVGLVKRGT